MITRLMAIYEKELRENPESGSLAIPRAIAERYPLVEWLGFEVDFRRLAESMGLDLEVEFDPASRRTVFRWRKVT